MSSKINVSEIIKGHLDTLKNGNSYSRSDLFTFFMLPMCLAILCALFKVDLDKDVISLFVNFGAIFTALLLSLLVLVYDQESKVQNAAAGDALKNKKSHLLKQLYHNISFAIFCSVVLIFICFINSALSQSKEFWKFEFLSFKFSFIMHLVNPVIIFLVGVVFLCILMILKRVHALLFVS